VARAKLEFIFENQGSSWNFHGLWLDFTKGQGANCKISGDFPVQNFFSMGKYGGLGPPSVDRGRRQSTVDHGQGLGGGSPELSLVAAPCHGGSPAVV
jgi:hypothetical protein